MEATLGGDLLLQLDHALLVAGRVGRLAAERPGQELVGVVGREAVLEDAEALAVAGDLVPVAADVGEAPGEVGEGALEDLAVELGGHGGLEVGVLGVGRAGLRQHEVRCALDGAHEGADPVRMLGQERLVADVQDGAEAAAAQLGQLVDAQHLHVGLGPALAREPLLQLHHLHVLQPDARVDLAANDRLGDVHAAPDRGVVVRRHAVVRGQLVNLDLWELVGQRARFF